MFSKLQHFMSGKKRYFMILAQAIYSFLGAFGVMTTTSSQDVAFVTLVMALLAIEIKTK